MYILHFKNEIAQICNFSSYSVSYIVKLGLEKIWLIEDSVICWASLSQAKIQQEYSRFSAEVFPIPNIVSCSVCK